MREHVRRIMFAIELAAENLKEDVAVLDIGCAYGYLEELIESNRYVGVDVFKYTPCPKTFVMSDLNTGVLPFRDNAFDIVFCIETLEHLFPIEEMVEEINRVLKDGGFAVISLPNELTLDRRFLFLLGKAPEPTKYGHHWFFTHQTAKKFLHNHFNVVAERGYYAVTGGRFLPKFLRDFLAQRLPSLFAKCWYVKAVKRQPKKE